MDRFEKQDPAFPDHRHDGHIPVDADLVQEGSG